MMAQTVSYWRGSWIHALFFGVVAALVGLFFYARLTWPIESTAAHLAYSPDGSKLLAATKYGDVQIWDLTHDPPQVKILSVRRRNTLLDDFGTPSMRFVDGKTVVALRHASATDESLELLYWNIEIDSKDAAVPLDCATEEVLGSHFGKWLGVIRQTEDAWQVQLWDLQRRAQVREVDMDRQPQAAGLFTLPAFIADDGRRLALSTEEGDNEYHELWDTADNVKLREVDAEVHFLGAEVAHALSPDGETYVLSDLQGLTINYLAADRSREWNHDHGYVVPFQFSSDGQKLLAMRKSPEPSHWTQPLQLVLCDLRAERIVPSPQYAAGVFSPDGQTVALCADAKVWLWNLETGSQERLPTMADNKFGLLCLSITGALLLAGVWGFVAIVRWILWLIRPRQSSGDVFAARVID